MCLSNYFITLGGPWESNRLPVFVCWLSCWVIVDYELVSSRASAVGSSGPGKQAASFGEMLQELCRARSTGTWKPFLCQIPQELGKYKFEPTTHAKAGLHSEFQGHFLHLSTGWSRAALSPSHCHISFPHPFSMGLASECSASHWRFGLNETVGMGPGSVWLVSLLEKEVIPGRSLPQVDPRLILL